MLREPAHQPGRLDPAAAATVPGGPACWTTTGGVQHQQAALRTTRRRASRHAGWPSLGVCAAAGGWIAASLIFRMAARPVLIAGMVITVAAVVGLWRAPPGGRHAVDLPPRSWPSGWCTAWPT